MVNAPDPVFWSPPVPNVIVCKPAAEVIDTVWFDATFNPNNAMSEFRTGLCARVKPLEKSAVVVPLGKTPPAQEADALKFDDPCTQLTACAGRIGRNPNTTDINTPKPLPNPPRNAQ